MTSTELDPFRHPLKESAFRRSPALWSASLAPDPYGLARTWRPQAADPCGRIFSAPVLAHPGQSTAGTRGLPPTQEGCRLCVKLANLRLAFGDTGRPLRGRALFIEEAFRQGEIVADLVLASPLAVECRGVVGRNHGAFA